MKKVILAAGDENPEPDQGKLYISSRLPRADPEYIFKREIM